MNVNKINNAQSLLEAYYKQANATGTQVRMSAENQKLSFALIRLITRLMLRMLKGFVFQELVAIFHTFP